MRVVGMRYVMVDASDATFEHSEEVLDAIGMSLTGPEALRVIDSKVLRDIPRKVEIDAGLIRVKNRLTGHNGL